MELELNFIIFLVYKMDNWYMLASQQNNKNALAHHFVFH